MNRRRADPAGTRAECPPVVPATGAAMGPADPLCNSGHGSPAAATPPPASTPPRRLRGAGRHPRLYDRFMRPLERLWFDAWRRRLWRALPAGGRGLEVGAGTGANFPYHPAGARLVAVDVSFPMLERARERWGGARPHLVVADAGALPFSAAAFDWAAATFVFCEVEDPVRGMGELRRVVRPGGPVALLEHVRPGGVAGRMADLLTRLTAPLWSEHFDRDAAHNARAAGFDVVSQRRFLRNGATCILARAPRRSARYDTLT